MGSYAAIYSPALLLPMMLLLGLGSGCKHRVPVDPDDAGPIASDLLLLPV